MRIIHSGGFKEDERRGIRALIYSNVITAFKVLLEIIEEENMRLEDERTRAHADLIASTRHNVADDVAFTDMDVKAAMLGMWEDDTVRQAVAKSHQYAENDNLSFYVENIERMFDPAWIPNDQDVLHARLKTTGITETLFRMKHINVRMMDVGGQRSERKKWIHCFEGVHCLLFMAALSGYDQCLVEDRSANQMYEALTLFDSLVNGEYFRNKPIILFLNKIDLFRARLKVSSLSTHFPDYQGRDDDEEAAKIYFADRFRKVNRTTDREIYIHYTNATDTNLLQSTMQDVQDVIVRQNFRDLIL